MTSSEDLALLFAVRKTKGIFENNHWKRVLSPGFGPTDDFIHKEKPVNKIGEIVRQRKGKCSVSFVRKEH